MFDFVELESDTSAMKLSIVSYPEKWLFAYVLDYLIQHGIRGQTGEDARVVFMATVILDSYNRVSEKSIT